MRLAILADVHANLAAFEAVLADVDEVGVDRLIVNGDMVNRGPQNVEVMELLSQTDATMTLGNHDDLLRMWVERDPALPAQWFEDPFWKGTAWCAEKLERSGWIEALKGLPMEYRVEPPGVPRLLIAHGSPRHYREGYGRFLTDDDIDAIGEEFRAEVLVGSHTHIPLVRHHGERVVLNSGAVGSPFNGDTRAQYLLLYLNGNEWEFEFRRVEYDRELTHRAYVDTGFLEEGGLSAHIFHEEYRLARSFLTPFLNWVEASGETLDFAGWEAFQRAFPERFALPGEPAAR